MLENRDAAARQLLARLKARAWHRPLVLAIPRGGVVLGAALARGLGAELDVILARKLRAPHQPEYALGAVCENGDTFYNDPATPHDPDLAEYLADERAFQLGEIARRARLFRDNRPPAAVAGRSVIVTDDGIATGATMIAALRSLQSQKPRHLVVAVPVAAPDSLREVARWCDDAVCLLQPDTFWAVGQFYRDFRAVEDETVIHLLHEAHLVSQLDPRAIRSASPYP